MGNKNGNKNITFQSDTPAGRRITILFLSSLWSSLITLKSMGLGLFSLPLSLSPPSTDFFNMFFPGSSLLFFFVKGVLGFVQDRGWVFSVNRILSFLSRTFFFPGTDFSVPGSGFLVPAPVFCCRHLFMCGMTRRSVEEPSLERSSHRKCVYNLHPDKLIGG